MFKIKSSEKIDCKYYILTESKLYYTAAESSSFLQGEMSLSNVLLELISPIDLKETEKLDLSFESDPEDMQAAKLGAATKIEKEMTESNTQTIKDQSVAPVAVESSKSQLKRSHGLHDTRNVVRGYELASILARQMEGHTKSPQPDKLSKSNRPTPAQAAATSGESGSLDLSRMHRIRFSKAQFFCEIGTLISEHFLILSQMLRKLCICTGFMQEFRIDKAFASWGSGEDRLYTCTNLHIDELKAVRVYSKKEVASDSKCFHQLRSTVTCLQKLKHPMILKLDCVYEDLARVYLLYENVRGPNLEKTMSMKFEFQESDVKFFFRGLVDTLGFIHSQGYVHRSLSSRTVMLKSTGVPGKDGNMGVIVGFKHAAALEDYCLLQTLQGEPGYLAPEIADGGYDPKTTDFCKVDVFALGVVIYFLLTGEKPFILPDHMHEKDQEYLVLPGSYYMIKRVPNQRYKAYSRGLRDLISKMLCLDPNKRYSTTQVLNSDYFGVKSIAGSRLVLNARNSRRPSSQDSSDSQMERPIPAIHLESEIIRLDNQAASFSDGPALKKMISDRLTNHIEKLRPQLKSVDDFAFNSQKPTFGHRNKSSFAPPKSILRQAAFGAEISSRSDDFMANTFLPPRKPVERLESKSLNELAAIGKSGDTSKILRIGAKSGSKFESEIVQKAILKLRISPPKLRKSILASESKRWDGFKLGRLSAFNRGRNATPHDLEEGSRPNRLRSLSINHMLDLSNSSGSFRTQQQVDRINRTCQVPQSIFDKVYLRVRVPLEPKTMKSLNEATSRQPTDQSIHEVDA